MCIRDRDECLRLENLAPHHKLFLLKYRAGLCKIDVREQSKNMFDEITAVSYTHLSDSHLREILDKVKRPCIRYTEATEEM